MRTGMLALGAGLLVLRFLPALPEPVWLLSMAAVGLPEWREGVVRFVLERTESRRAELPTRLRLSWHQGPELRSGERWRLAVHLKRPHGMQNPGGFDYEAWLLVQRIGATGTVK